VATLPEYQGKGLTKALLTRLFDLYNELGFDGFIYLTSQTWSYKAINIYSKFGFLPYTGQKPLNWTGENETFSVETEKAWDMIQHKIWQYKNS
jgi:Acetyltransferases